MGTEYQDLRWHINIYYKLTFWLIYYENACVIKPISLSKIMAYIAKYELLLLKYISFRSRILSFGCIWGKGDQVCCSPAVSEVYPSCHCVIRYSLQTLKLEWKFGNEVAGGSVHEDDSFYLFFWKMWELFCQDFWPKFEVLSYLAQSLNNVTKTWVIKSTWV